MSNLPPRPYPSPMTTMSSSFIQNRHLTGNNNDDNKKKNLVLLPLTTTNLLDPPRLHAFHTGRILRCRDGGSGHRPIAMMK
jgi:hypothetical protein